MNRREAIKNTAIFMGSAATISSLGMVMKGCTPARAVDWTSLEDEYVQQMLAEIVETIIPATEEPGAKALGVHQYITRILTNCHEIEEQKDFLQGLKHLEEVCNASIGKSFVECEGSQREEVLKGMVEMAEQKEVKASLKSFFSQMKKLTIEGYMKTEYVVTNVLEYKLVPGPYIACVPVGANS